MSAGQRVVWMLSAVAACGMHAQSVAKGYVKADPAGCQVWAPSMFQGDDHVARYTGGCKGGFADGKGKVEWTTPAAGTRVMAMWDGNFRSGIFTGDRVVSFSITPVGGDDYMVDWGKVRGGELIEIATGQQTGGMELCRAEYLGVRLAPEAVVADDDVMKNAMKSAVARFEELCPKAAYRVDIGTYNTDMEWHTTNFRAEPTAHASVMLGTTELEQYVNKAATTTRQKDRQGAFEAEREAGHQAFDAFSAKNKIAAWVTTEQLERNPFKYEGKVVGVVVKLDKMLSRDTALVSRERRTAMARSSCVALRPTSPANPKLSCWRLQSESRRSSMC